ncbi:C40 family peptidase [Sporosarcina sp. Marseille-Q4063]|uniref:C40 family peptidase n=1 Tax=Sporosarcina sp. Marseille-Q4063 TaxID=2810514 RepID=UPI001BAFC43E|nr:C40 family peptidase [Sporosarcina sp. Marseille-Q4063]QUW21233.1 C40 family peptidase [Sporosarcina sp. Marseille-Q4063]
MRKVVISLVTAASILLTTAAIDAHATETVGQANVQHESSYTYETVTKVASTKATAKSGSFKLKYNTNVRTDAGTKNKIIITAKKGSTATATHQKTVGKETWYNVNVSGKSGWVLSTLLTPATVAKAPAKAPAKTAAPKAPAKVVTNLGAFTTKYNSNIRSNAGTTNKILTTAKKGTNVTATDQKKVGKTTWYKVSANGKTGWVSADLLAKATTTATAKAAPAKTITKVSNTTFSSNLVANAMKLRGVPYRYGGSSTSGFDCSGYVQYVYKQSGKSIPRDTLGQYAATKKVSNPQPGDLVFFAGTYRAGISHVGIYIGNNQFIQSGGKNVHVRSMSDPYWSKYFHSYRSF